MVELLTYTYAKRAEGGGFSNIDVPKLFDELRTLSADAGASIFQIPPYFACKLDEPEPEPEPEP